MIDGIKKLKFDKVSWDSLLNINDSVEEIKLKHPKVKSKVFEVNQNKIMKDGKIEDNRKDFY